MILIQVHGSVFPPVRAPKARSFMTGAGTGIQTLVSVEGHRWAIEDSYETAKNELGLDHNETRSWHGWHRHVSLVMLACAMMAVIRYRANDVAPQKRPRMPTIRI